MKKRYSNQQLKKLQDGKCLVCEENKYELLDAHRIIEGGTYHKKNIVTLCAKCHRKVHCGEIRFDRKYDSTKGLMLHWWYGETEHWTPVLS